MQYTIMVAASGYCECVCGFIMEVVMVKLIISYTPHMRNQTTNLYNNYYYHCCHTYLVQQKQKDKQLKQKKNRNKKIKTKQ